MNNVDKEALKSQNRGKPPNYYIGIGASAGGLEALEEFFRTFPETGNMAFIVVQHLAPDYKSMMVELLSRHTKMKVVQIKDGMKPEANSIYLIPPQNNLTIYHEQLILTEQVRKNSINLPIDIFFRSLALDQSKKAVGIILSGTGSDGTLGIKAIKENGGLVMVQNISEAKFDGMPKSAISTGLVDYVLRAGEMSDALINYFSHPNVLKEDGVEDTKEETDYVKILSLVRTNIGIDFSYYKPTTIIRRIERRISINQLQNSNEYIKLLLNNQKECEILSRELLIGVTQFFRDNEAYRILQEEVIPGIFKDRKKNEPVRIWSVGCSTGEEAYSIAILCHDYIDRNNLTTDFKIFATDLDKEAIRVAGAGAYPESIVADVPEHLLKKYFIKNRDIYQVKETIRQLVVFAEHDVTANPPFSKITLVVCRNLLIYFKPEMQLKVLSMFQYALSAGGYMFLGSSESTTGVSDSFDVISQKWKIYKYRIGFAQVPLTKLLPVGNKLRSFSSDVKNIPSTFTKTENPLLPLYEQALNYVTPAGVIVDKNNTIIHFLKDVRRFLSVPEGKADNNILNWTNSQLTMVLSNMLYKVRKERGEVQLNRIKFVEANKAIYINLSAKLLSPKKGSDDFIIITFKESYEQEQRKETVSNDEYDYEEQAAQRIKELERELQHRDENLQTTIEEMETSNEELQATNEELVSSNEELQSTNEELQSVNEELYTVNSQYQEKISELTDLNNDINNLLTNTDIGTLYLDSQLVVRKFTKKITATINLIEVDIGRPFSHITSNCDYTDFYNDALHVINTLEKRAVEVFSNDGNWYLLKLQPYRHSDNSIHGVLVTQVNIHELKTSRLENFKLNKVLEYNTNGVLITDRNGSIEYVNKAFEKMTGYKREQCLNKNPRIFKSGLHKKEFYEKLWNKITSGKTWYGKIKNRRKNGELYWENNTISCIKDENDEIVNYFAIKEDITEDIEKLSINLIDKKIIENTRNVTGIGTWVLNLRNNELKWSEEVYSIFEKDPKTFTPTFDEFLKLIYEKDRNKVKEAYSNAIKNKTQYAVEHRIKLSSGDIKYVKEVSQEIIDSNGEPQISVGSIIDITKNKKTEQLIKKQNKKLEKINQANSLLIQSLPVGVARHKMKYRNNIAFDYEFIEVNNAFEKITGLEKEKLIGKTVKEVLPETEEFWIKKYDELASNGQQITFQQYSLALDKNFEVTAYSMQKGYFTTIFQQIDEKLINRKKRQK